jgi:DNA-binding MarR family transcriptional regulator
MMATTPTPTYVSQSVMLAAALQNAALGNYVFPLHTPIFNEDGKCTGCTCEEWKRSEEYREHLAKLRREREFNPNFKCDQPGKCPRVAWAEKSTVDPVTIGKWWGKTWRNVDVETGQVVWSIPNLAVDCGKSGLLVPDLDSYKESYAGGALFLNENTVKSITGGGGSHLWYRMPEGKAYGNATGNLPKGIDIRGAGGYVVVAPSLHKSGRRYTFAEGFSPADIAPLPLPQSLIDILETAQEAHSGPTVIFSKGYAPMPDLAQWGLSADTCELIQKGVPQGERSEADWRVVCELVRAGATDDDIRAVFVHFAIGSKFDEQGDKYLARTVSRARAKHLPSGDGRLAGLRAWNGGADCVGHLREARAKGVAELVALFDAIVEIAQAEGTIKVATTVRALAIACAVRSSTLHRRLSKLVDAGFIALSASATGTTIDLSPIIFYLGDSGTLPRNVESVPLSPSLFLTEHRGDDAFTSYAYTHAIKRRAMPTVLLTSLGATALLLWPALEIGGTVDDLATRTGLSCDSVRRSLKRMWAAGLLFVWQEGRSYCYLLHPDAEQRLEERRGDMVTDGIGLLRTGRNYSDVANYAHKRLKQDDLEPYARAKLEERQHKADMMAMICFDTLERRGINPYRVGNNNKEIRPRIRFDAREEWRSHYRDIWEALQALGEMHLSDKVRLLTVATVGEDATPEQWQAARREIAEQVDTAMSLSYRRVKFEREHDDVQFAGTT